MESRAAFLVAARMVYLGVPLVARKVCKLQRGELMISCILSFLKPETSPPLACAVGHQIVPAARFPRHPRTIRQHCMGGW